jgi:hypothetical protein
VKSRVLFTVAEIEIKPTQQSLLGIKFGQKMSNAAVMLKKSVKHAGR